MKKLIIPFIVSVYLTQISLIIAIALADKLQDNSLPVTIPIYVFSGIAVCLGIANIILAINNIFKPSDKVYKVTMICKLALIPFYIINFVLGILLVIGTLAILLSLFALIIAAIIALGVLATYAIMFVTSSYNLAHFIYEFRQGDKPIIPLVIYFILHLIFVADFFCSVYIYFKEKNEKVS